MWYEYDWKHGENDGHYITEDKSEILKALIILLGDILNKNCKANFTEEKITINEHTINIYVKYYYNDGLQWAKFGNIPYSSLNIDTYQLFNKEGRE